MSQLKGRKLFFLFALAGLLFSSFAVTAQVPDAKRQVVIKSARKINAIAIESIIITADHKGTVVKTADGKTYFLNRDETKQQLDITVTDNGFLLPKDASATYYDQNGVPSDNYNNYDYAKMNNLVLPYPMKTLHVGVSPDNIEPLYIINGKEASKEEMFQLDPTTIEKVDVLKGDAAALAYGERARSGVVVITLKALYIIDGKESSKEEMTKLNSSTIEKVTVLNKDSAVSMYGERGRNGVIVITLKQQPTTDTTAKPIEVAPVFPGGTTAWRKYIEKSVRYPREAITAKVSGKVRVSVTVAEDGSLSAVPLTSFGYGLEDEAIRIMKESPKWSPATHNGQPVTYKFSQSVSFNTF